jgi:hypothetical protein
MNFGNGQLGVVVGGLNLTTIFWSFKRKSFFKTPELNPKLSKACFYSSIRINYKWRSIFR